MADRPDMQTLTEFLNKRAPLRAPRNDHDWTRGVCGQTPVIECTRAGCDVVWWPDRSEPKSKCAGGPS